MFETKKKLRERIKELEDQLYWKQVDVDFYRELKNSYARMVDEAIDNIRKLKKENEELNEAAKIANENTDYWQNECRRAQRDLVTISRANESLRKTIERSEDCHGNCRELKYVRNENEKLRKENEELKRQLGFFNPGAYHCSHCDIKEKFEHIDRIVNFKNYKEM